MPQAESIYHSGELAVQAAAGLLEQAQHAALLIHPTIPLVAREFLEEQRMAIVATLDTNGRVWASAVTGPKGFLHAPDKQTVEIRVHPLPSDPLAENLKHPQEIGAFVIEFSSRLRMKVKGPFEWAEDGRIVVRIKRVFSQCRKYIQVRQRIEDSPRSVGEADVTRASHLSNSQQAWIAKADTFFVASYHPATGADASHRGGNPGFIEVVDQNTLVFPNYYGNTMFNTLGNITVTHKAALLFIDFSTGTTLQMTGNANVIWDKERIAKVPGANQLVEFRADEVIETSHAIPLRWKFLAYSGANPS